MYGLLIVEDEKFARDYIGKYIEKNLNEYFEVYLAENGSEALRILDNSNIDVVITDIKMPGISGLELVKIIYENYRDVVTMIMSGYEEFEYAKTAIRYNVKEYFVKPFDLDELNEILTKTARELGRRGQKNVFDDTGTLYEERERFFVDLIYGGVYSSEEAIKKSENLRFHFDIEKTPCDIIVLKIDDYDKFLAEKWAYTKDSLKTAVNNLVSGFLESECIFCVSSEDGYFEYIVYYYGIKSFDCEDLANKMNNILNLPIKIYKKYGTFSNLDELISSVNTDENTEEKALLLSTYIREGNHIEAKRLLQSVVNSKGGTQKLEKLLSHIASYINSKENITEISDVDIYNTDELYSRITDSSEINSEDGNASIELAKKYIQKNYARNISREEVAKAAYFSPAYFTRNFKLYTGYNFSDYLLKVRMENAISLMKEKKYRIYEIAEKVGYENIKYFFRVFKLYTGYTPKDYMIKVLGQEEL